MVDSVLGSVSSSSPFASSKSSSSSSTSSAGSLGSLFSGAGGASFFRNSTSSLSTRIGALSRQIDKVGEATDAVEAARNAARSIARTLRSAQTLIDDIDPQVVSVNRVTTRVPTYPVYATGRILLADSLNVSGTASLAAASPASGSGLLDLSPVSGTGSTALSADAAVSVTGTKDATSSSYILGGTVGQGQTLTIDTGSGAQTITFGIFGGQVDSSSELEAAIDAIDGVEASFTAEGYLSITGADATTNFTIGGTADVQSAFGISEQSYSAFNLLDQGVNEGETLTVQVGGGATQTITFGTGAGEIATRDGLATALSGLSGASFALDGGNHVTFTAESADDTVTLGGTADLAGAFGLAAGTYDPEDLLGQGVSQGETLTFKVGSGSVQTITFGTGGGEVQTVDDLNAALSGLSGLTASIGADRTLIFTADDATSSITVGGTADLSGVFGITQSSYDPTNLLDQGLSQGDTLTIQSGSGDTETITFGTGAGEVATLSDLTGALSSLTTVNASIDDNGKLTVDPLDGTSSVTIGGSAASTFGLEEKTYTINSFSSLGIGEGETLQFTVGDQRKQTIVFNKDNVDSFEKLDAALRGISGISARIDEEGRLTFQARNRGDSVKVGGTLNTLETFGIKAKTYNPKTRSSTEVQKEITPADVPPSFAENLGLLRGEIESAAPDGGPNLIAGFTSTLEASESGRSSLTFGGYDLTPETLGLDLPEDFTVESQADLDALAERLQTAIEKADYVVGRLEQDKLQLEAFTDFTSGVSTIVKDSGDTIDDLADARKTTIETRKQLALTQLTAFAGNGSLTGADRITYAQLASAAGSDSGLFQTTDPVSAQLALVLALNPSRT